MKYLIGKKTLDEIIETIEVTKHPEANKWVTPGRFKDNRIGDTLDDIIKGNIKVHQFPPISVTKKPGGNKWFTLDNRRLWIFHRLEAHGMCKEIDVNVVEYSLQHGRKFTSNNGGVAISVRGFPGGEWVRRITPVVPKCVQPKTPDKSETPLETTATTFSSTSSVDNILIATLRK
ncbi:hypothetical protein MAR_028229 [Mya arenaria]|uniref:Uncharacterized protein n=1 Tax=Mya arenaria TaxID=6604 RepID=A0ABY7DGH3_MYAAR|nr:hypothetical protein MAR_028229 [Mya arenaria]